MLKFWTDGTTTMIAESAEDARAAYREYLSDPSLDESEAWTELETKGEPLTCTFEERLDAKDFPEGAVVAPAAGGSWTSVTMTPSQWLRSSPRGFFGTSEM